MNKAVFLDRDGVINAMVYDQEHGTLDSPANPHQFELLKGVGPAIRLLNEMGWLVVVVSNQPGIAKGKYTPRLLEAMNHKMQAELARWGAYLDAIYYCLHHPQAVVKEYRTICCCRKPLPGLLLKGRDELNIDLRRSYLVGDGLIDIQAGRGAGCKTILLGRPKCCTCKLMDDMKARPHFMTNDLAAAVRLIHDLESSRRLETVRCPEMAGYRLQVAGYPRP
jgi:D-glycero-D-manno-heptose 1,7-bisphosphate phosphatase